MVYAVLRIFWGLLTLVFGQLPPFINLEVAAGALEPALEKSKRLGPGYQRLASGRFGQVAPLLVSFIDSLSEVWSASSPPAQEPAAPESVHELAFDEILTADVSDTVGGAVVDGAGAVGVLS